MYHLSHAQFQSSCFILTNGLHFAKSNPGVVERLLESHYEKEWKDSQWMGLRTVRQWQSYKTMGVSSSKGVEDKIIGCELK